MNDAAGAGTTEFGVSCTSRLAPRPAHIGSLDHRHARVFCFSQSFSMSTADATAPPGDRWQRRLLTLGCTAQRSAGVEQESDTCRDKPPTTPLTGHHARMFLAASMHMFPVPALVPGDRSPQKGLVRHAKSHASQENHQPAALIRGKLVFFLRLAKALSLCPLSRQKGTPLTGCTNADAMPYDGFRHPVHRTVRRREHVVFFFCAVLAWATSWQSHALKQRLSARTGNIWGRTRTVSRITRPSERVWLHPASQSAFSVSAPSTPCRRDWTSTVQAAQCCSNLVPRMGSAGGMARPVASHGHCGQR